MQLTPIFKDILEASLLAPSADNHHRLLFETRENEVLVWSEPGRLRNLTGYKRTLDLISLGAVIENIALRASAYSLEALVELLPPDKLDLVARILFQPTSNTPDPLHAAIPLRHTNRRFFKGPAASPETLRSIQEEAGRISGCNLDWLDTTEQRSKALQLIRRAEGERFRTQVLHAELFENIRFSVGWNQTCDEALPPGALEIEPPLRFLFRTLRHWPVMRALNFILVYKQLGWRAGDLPCRLSPHLGVISTRSLTDTDQINAGRSFQRVWLRSTTYGLALQPMPASVLYAQHAAIDQGILDKLQRYLQAGWEELTPMRIPLMVFRMGNAPAPEIVTGRKPLDTYLIEHC